VRQRSAGSVATAAGLALAGLLTSTPAWAGLTATGRKTAAQSSTSGSWGVVPTVGSTAPASPSALTLTFQQASNKNNPSPAQYFNVVNNGTLALLTATYSLSQSDTTQYSVRDCTGTWTTSTGACSGTITTLVSTSAGTTAGSGAAVSAVPATPGGLRQLQLLPTTGSVNMSGTCTVSVAVARTGVRAATTTSS
jgi:hypothetical protein